MGHNRGFTLIEIAVVLLIVSLVLVALLKGENVLRAARIQDVITLAQDLSTATNNFKQRYHMLPGDFPIDQATPEISGITRSECLLGGSNKGDGNGLIDSGGNAAGSLGVPAEVQCVPEVLFQAGMVNKVDKETDSNGIPWSVFRTRFGVRSRVWVKAVSTSNVVAALVAAAILSPYSPSVTHVIEFENLPCSVVWDIDRQIDNDNLSTGRGAASDPACVKDTLVDFALAL
jgi:prepilin-type N-terminal cleavage/methylation domain-containing protein